MGAITIKGSFRRKAFDVALPVLLTIVNCIIGVMASVAVLGRSGLPVNMVSHEILIALAFLGIVACDLNLVEAGIISRNFRYSLYWGLYLSVSVCVPALAFIGILHVLGIVSLEVNGLSTYGLAVNLATSLMLGGFCEELFYRGFVQGSLNRAVGQRLSPIASGIIFGVAHISNYVNPFTGTYSLSVGAVIWVLLSCFAGVFFGFLRRKCGDIYCSTLFHGSQDFTTYIMSVLKCPSSISTMALGVGWIIFLTITYRQFTKSKPRH